jgi:hypothetical protein
LTQGKKIEASGGFLIEQNGGSSRHGSTEVLVLYRLHASRLKCLLTAVINNTHEDDRSYSELEALRLTEKYWYKTPEGDLPTDLRAQVWNVLTDVVAALAQCRIEHCYFHRSIYRHAQALMWAPVLFDPVNGRVDGSLGTVPSTWAFKLRGLNYSTTY